MSKYFQTLIDVVVVVSVALAYEISCELEAFLLPFQKIILRKLT